MLAVRQVVLWHPVALCVARRRRQPPHHRTSRGWRTGRSTHARIAATIATLVQKFGSATIHPRQTSKGSAFSESPSGTQPTSKSSCNKSRLNTRSFSKKSPHLKTCKPPGCSSCFVPAPVPTTYCETCHRPQRPLLPATTMWQSPVPSPTRQCLPARTCLFTKV